ncbi:Assimilatory nitrate reductase large subunit [hydrothermal vent metagenome]|uniref:Assimilatory nitrate reductase large subunit n=1 Tax=hydrothermal vent metagenome TaxID=652676 RepID=A0A3B1DX04_9ZZZZ
MKNILQNLIYQRDGKLTQELALASSECDLGKLPKRLLPETTANIVCGYCATGCGLKVHLKDNKPVNLTPNTNYPVNLGEACPKGWEALAPLKAKDRATTPYLRNSSGKLEAVSWDEALKEFVNRFKAIQQKNGNESVAFISTGQIPTEEMALLGALTKFGMGWIHGDGNTRQCMASAVVAYKQSFGFDAPPYTYKDFEESDVLVFVGANPCIAHPIMWERVCRNQNDPKIIVVDPRKTETAMAATHHYALTPKADLALFYGLANILISNDWIDQKYIKAHTTEFEFFKKHVQEFAPEYVSQLSGLTVKQIQEFAKIIGEGKRVSFWWTMGVNQSYEGVRVAQAIINLALMTGNMGRPGKGANSITGQCNAMGSRLFSNTTGLLGGYDFLNEKHRSKVAKILNIDSGLIPFKNSLPYDKIMEGVASRKIKGLWVIATNPAHSWINQSEYCEVLGNLDFLVVQDMYYSTETAQMADMVLPAAGWGEKEGTFINSERRVGLLQKVAKAPGEALADFYIFKLIAKYWGCEDVLKGWDSPEDVFHILKNLSKGQPCDMSGIRDYKMINDLGGIQWPFTKEDSDFFLSRKKVAVPFCERRLFEDGKYYHPDGKAKFIFDKVKPIPEVTSEKYPFILLTGRGTSSQWHTQTRTGKSKVLKRMYPQEVYVEVNIDDARRMDINPGQWILVKTQRGRIKARANIVPTVKPGQIFMPMHYVETNKLTFPAFDTFSRQPSYKICAAKLSSVPYYE